MYQSNYYNVPSGQSVPVYRNTTTKHSSIRPPPVKPTHVNKPMPMPVPNHGCIPPMPVPAPGCTCSHPTPVPVPTPDMSDIMGSVMDWVIKVIEIVKTSPDLDAAKLSLLSFMAFYVKMSSVMNQEFIIGLAQDAYNLLKFAMGIFQALMFQQQA